MSKCPTCGTHVFEGGEPAEQTENARLLEELRAALKALEASQLGWGDARVARDLAQAEAARLRAEVDRLKAERDNAHDEMRRTREGSGIECARVRDEWQKSIDARDLLTADLARVTGQRDALLAAAKPLLGTVGAPSKAQLDVLLLKMWSALRAAVEACGA